jgi:eukaryotic-like serine/threonine-protein kinase
VRATEDEDLPAAGDVIAGKYEVVRAIGRGGMGVVLEARHLKLGQGVALKVLLPSARTLTDVTMRFEREARAAARLQGPHITRILDVDTLADGSPFMVMELLRGKELGDELTSRGKLPVREAVGYVLQACAGMAEAHRAGIVHRDLKPSNLFLCDGDGTRTVKVLDFGISKLLDDVHMSMTTTASAFGTPLYMSPEQVRSVKHVDARSDIWSLGVVLYELLAGKSPFERATATAVLAAIVVDPVPPLNEVRPDVPAPLSAAVTRALEKNAAQRFGDVREFAAAIAPYGPSRDDPAQAAVEAELERFEPSPFEPSPNATTTIRRAPPRSGRRAILAGVGLGMIAAGATLAFLLKTRPRPVVIPSAETPTAAPTATAPPPGVTPEPTASAAPADPPKASAAPAITPVTTVKRKPPGAATATATGTAAPPKATADPIHL